MTGLSNVMITVDNKSDLYGVVLESTHQLFVQQSKDTYKISQINISIFINILIGVKSNGWCLMGTNAFLDNAQLEIIKTFYFEKSTRPRTTAISGPSPLSSTLNNGNTKHIASSSSSSKHTTTRMTTDRTSASAKQNNDAVDVGSNSTIGRKNSLTQDGSTNYSLNIHDINSSAINSTSHMPQTVIHSEVGVAVQPATPPVPPEKGK